MNHWKIPTSSCCCYESINCLNVVLTVIIVMLTELMESHILQYKKLLIYSNHDSVNEQHL